MNTIDGLTHNRSFEPTSHGACIVQLTILIKRKTCQFRIEYGDEQSEGYYSTETLVVWLRMDTITGLIHLIDIVDCE